MSEVYTPDRANSGNFTAPGKGGTSLQLHREGVQGLVKGVFETPWERVKEINVYQDRAEWILKDQCACGASPSTYYNPECSRCGGFGIIEGDKVVIPHDMSDAQNVDWYINLEGLVMFWARQSGTLTRLRDGTPVFNKDMPKVNFLCLSKKDQLDPEAMNIPMQYGGNGPIRKRAFAFHDEYRRELVKIAMEKQQLKVG